MTDYLQALEFGTFLTPSAEHADRVVELALLTEAVGLDLATIQDHPYQARFLDTWTVLAVIAARTSSLRVAPNVANLPLRPPLVLAKSVASLDRLSHGRVDLGLGAGGFWDAIVAAGGTRRTPGQAVDALAEAITIIRSVWREPSEDREPVRVEGEHYRVVGVHPGPAPAHPVEIWIGALKPRLLGLTGRIGDGWLPSQSYAGLEELPAMNARIDEAAAAAGRDPAEIRRLYNINGAFGSGSGFLQGSAADWAEQLAELTLAQGMSTYILAGDDPDDIARFGSEVAPAVRELVANGRLATASVPTDHPIEIRAVPTTDSEGEFAVRPTVDDGRRRSGERLWDESQRPTGPPRDRDRRYSAQEQASGQHLVDVHNMLRAELTQLRDVIDQVAAGALDVGGARSLINSMALRQNNWTLGAFCESYCRVVTTHHTIEDQSMFPALRRGDPRLDPVIDRLHEEHEVIAEVLDRVDRALVSLVSGPDGLGRVRAAVDLLEDALLSHLSYEERELVEPIARLGLL